MAESEAWVTLATNDSYCLGALVLGTSLRRVGTSRQLVVMVTPGVSPSMRTTLESVFNLVKEVNVMDSEDSANLAILTRPELGITFTKLHCWKLTQYTKCVFLDADTLIIQNCDELFDRDEFSAAPDSGWPDCFNSGVFVYRPSQETFDRLLRFAVEIGSFDGGDQGLLNSFFNDWSTSDIGRHLPFIYNMVASAVYSYIPAYRAFAQKVKIVHFIGPNKPWLQFLDTTTGQVRPSPGEEHLQGLLQAWWDIFRTEVHHKLLPDMKGLAGAFAQMSLEGTKSDEQLEQESIMRKHAWEQGHIDYLGKDSFDNILKKIHESMAKADLDKQKEPSPPKMVPSKETSPSKATPQKEPTSPESLPLKELSPPIIACEQKEPSPSTPAQQTESSPPIATQQTETSPPIATQQTESSPPVAIQQTELSPLIAVQEKEPSTSETPAELPTVATVIPESDVIPKSEVMSAVVTPEVVAKEAPPPTESVPVEVTPSVMAPLPIEQTAPVADSTVAVEVAAETTKPPTSIEPKASVAAATVAVEVEPETPKKETTTEPKTSVPDVTVAAATVVDATVVDAAVTATPVVDATVTVAPVVDATAASAPVVDATVPVEVATEITTQITPIADTTSVPSAVVDATVPVEVATEITTEITPVADTTSGPSAATEPQPPVILPTIEPVSEVMIPVNEPLVTQAHCGDCCDCHPLKPSRSSATESEPIDLTKSMEELEEEILAVERAALEKKLAEQKRIAEQKLLEERAAAAVKKEEEAKKESAPVPVVPVPTTKKDAPVTTAAATKKDTPVAGATKKDTPVATATKKDTSTKKEEPIKKEEGTAAASGKEPKPPPRKQPAKGKK